LRAKGLEETILAFVAGLPEDSEIEITPEDDSPFASLEYSVGDAQDGSEPTEENLKPQWSLLGNELEKDLYEFPGIGELTPGTPVSLADTAEAIKEIAKGLEFVEENPDAIGTTYADIDLFFGPVASHVFLLKARGQESYLESQYVVQRTVNLPKGYAGKWDIENVGKQYTTAQLIEAEAIPTEIKFTMPGAGVWIKKAPQITPDGAGRYQVADEWVHAQYASTIIYPAFTP